ncbi:MAG: hypothetical protein ACHQAX_02990 [Gammaproteobacteria bacterium]
MPKDFVLVYIWKKPSPTASSFSFMSWAGTLFSKPSNEVHGSELGRRDSHIAISIPTETDSKYFSFWPEPLIQTTECGGYMHSQNEDVQSMGRKADLILIIKDADTEKAFKKAKYFAALWVNHLDFAALPWERALAYKTYAPQNEAQSDHSAVSIYGILLSAIDCSKADIRLESHGAGEVTTETLHAALIAHPQVSSDISAYPGALSEEQVVLPEYPLYLKLKDDRLKMLPEDQREIKSSLQYRGTEFNKVLKMLLVVCTMGDGKKASFPITNIETDSSRYNEAKGKVQVKLK